MPTRGTLFPDTIIVTDYSRELVKLQERIAPAFGDPQINVPHNVDQYEISWSSTFLTASELDTLKAHFRDNATTYFSFYDSWTTRSIDKNNFTTIVALQLTYTLPAKATNTIVLYDSDGTVISSSRYTVQVGTGTEGENKIVFNSTGVLPATGHVIAFSADVGRRKWACWYTTQKFPEAHLEVDYWQLREPLHMVTSVLYV